MKIWLFALLEAMIAALGLAAYFWAEDMVVTGLAATTAAILGIAQPLLAARQARSLAKYQDNQFQKSVDSLDQQMQSLFDELIEPPLPHRETLQALLDAQFADDAHALGAQYDRLRKAIESKSFAVEELAAAFADKVHHHPVGAYLCGLAAFSQDQNEDARRHFANATKQMPGWILPWLGWATAAYKCEKYVNLAEQHPHVNGVELVPYDVGDEQTFIDLSEDERESLVEQFQAAARALGNYYTLAELQKSRVQIDASREEYRKAA